MREDTKTGVARKPPPPPKKVCSLPTFDLQIEPSVSFGCQGFIT